MTASFLMNCAACPDMHTAVVNRSTNFHVSSRTCSSSKVYHAINRCVRRYDGRHDGVSPATRVSGLAQERKENSVSISRTSQQACQLYSSQKGCAVWQSLAERSAYWSVKNEPNFSRRNGRTFGAKSAVVPVSSAVATSEPANESTASGNASVVHKRVVVLGGTGRVGGSTAASLASFSANGTSPDCEFVIDLVLAGRNSQRGEAACERVGGGSTYVTCDIDDSRALRKTIEGADLVVHTAGPFQRKESCDVLRAAIDTKTPYMDVCDDREYSQATRALHDLARDAGVPAITTAGIYPGVSNLMAAELVRLAAGGGSGGEAANQSETSSTPKSQPKSVRFSYYTAGSGGAGPTILATSFLLLGEEALVILDGKRLNKRPYSARRAEDFGTGIGSKSVYLLNLPEVESIHQVLGVPTVSARFGTDPPFWNWAMEAMVALLPPAMLKDRARVQQIVEFTDPVVRQVDKWAGEKVGMRVDLECLDGRKSVALYTHMELSKCVGQASAAFALAMLEGSTEPGVWFPEEVREGDWIPHDSPS
eukprot:TRINITY_DN1697_c0_g1_i1.p1 TRINITY_DN1697_c0_g1~~TRINITY_DN1697_c0_g1_i1.p1  ORF type:complete len:537 (-),score=59.39 TRINITY_DN1697_c0_g1_i1:25-1635(-)